MKRILITGANSFLGDSTKKYLEELGDYQIEILDMLNSSWKNFDFSNFDVVFNVCAIVHRPNEKDADLYYKVNRDLAVEIATIAKSSGVHQFIQTSTVGVFGIELGEMSISKGFNPKSPYEKSKFEADLMLEKLRDSNFKVCIIRPPLIYGKGCKGNFPRLESFALKYSVFPSLKNQRDFIYIENMCDFVKCAIDLELNEVCYPRNNEKQSVAEMVKLIASYNGRKVFLWSFLNPFVKLLLKTSKTLRSVFGDCYCIENICCSFDWVAPVSFEESIKKIYKE